MDSNRLCNASASRQQPHKGQIMKHCHFEVKKEWYCNKSVSTSFLNYSGIPAFNNRHFIV